MLMHTNPEAEGIPSSAILNFIRAVEQHTHPLDAVQGFVLLRHGNVTAEGWWMPYGPQSPHSLYSLSKSFTSTGIGLAVAEGRLTVDDPVLEFFPDDAPSSPSENLKAMRVRHLLSMNTGHKEDTTRYVFQSEDDNWARVFLALPIEYQPGTWFVYNTAATYMLSAIITRLTGESLLDYLHPRLFDPLGIENPVWETDPRGINIGGTGLHVTTEDIAHFGQMYLQKGTWQGKRIVPEKWIIEATRATSDNSNTQTNPDWMAGYGYQFWRCRHNAYRGDGAFGQYCIIMPEQDAVLTMISGVQDMQVVLNKVWEHLLPAMQPGALPADSQAYNELCDKLAVLSLPLVNGQASSPNAEQWSGKTFKLDSNHLKFESVVMQFGDKRNTLIIRDGRGEHRIQLGYSTWLKGTTDMRGRGDESIAACGAWIAEDTYEVRICFYEDAFCPVFRFHYTGAELQLEVEPNATWEWEPMGVTKITGRVAGKHGRKYRQLHHEGDERMTTWTNDELKKIETAEELKIASLRQDGTLQKPVIIWVVRVGDELYVRSVNGRTSAWFRGVESRHEGQIRAGGVVKDVTFVEEPDPAINEQIDAVYRTKYRRYAESIINSIITSEARSATIKLVPRAG